MSSRVVLVVPSLLLVLLSLAGCGGRGGASLTPPPPQVTVTSVAITPATTSLAVNATEQLHANANYSDRTAKDVSTKASWSSSDVAVVKVSSVGLVTALAPGKARVTASDDGQSASADITVSAPSPTITVISIAPQNVSINAGNTQQLKATAMYSDNSTSDVTGSVSWASSAGSIAAVSNSGLVSALAQGTATITAATGSLIATDTVTVAAVKPPPPASVSVTTFHFDNKRTGVNNNETTLTPANVNSSSFGKLFSLTVDGYIYAQPLYVSGLTINGAQHNVVFVSTEKNNVYAFDADNFNNNTPLWQTSLLNAGEVPAGNGNPSPYRGSTSTPVIDTGSKMMYVVTAQTPGKGTTFRLNAIDITTGNLVKAVPVTAQVAPAKNSDTVNGVLTLPGGCTQRSALLLDNGSIYFGFSACDSGWLLAYDEATLMQKGVFAVGPNNDGNGAYKGDGGIWMGGSGPVSDGIGNVYITTGNGPYSSSSAAYGDSILRLDSTLNLKDWFTPEDWAAMQCQDQDLSGGGMLMLPNGNLVAGGKSGKVYQVDSANLGQGPHAGNSGAITTLYPGDNVGLLSYPFSCTAEDTSNPPSGQPYPTGTWNGTKTPYQLFGTPVYFNNSVYVGMTPGPVVQLTMDGTGKLTLTSNATKERIATSSYGTTPVISANNSTNAVLWFVDHGTPLQSGTATNAVLRAYDPKDLGKELYDSSMNAADNAGFGVKFTAPIVANGKVFVVSANDSRLADDSKGEVDVYGLK